MIMTMLGDHEVMVAAAGVDWEADCVVGVERADRIEPEVKIFRRVRQERVIDGGGRRVQL